MKIEGANREDTSANREDESANREGESANLSFFDCCKGLHFQARFAAPSFLVYKKQNGLHLQTLILNVEISMELKMQTSQARRATLSEWLGLKGLR